MPFADSLLYLA